MKPKLLFKLLSVALRSGNEYSLIYHLLASQKPLSIIVYYWSNNQVKAPYWIILKAESYGLNRYNTPLFTYSGQLEFTGVGCIITAPDKWQGPNHRLRGSIRAKVFLRLAEIQTLACQY